MAARGGLTSMIEALADANVLPLVLVLTPGQAGECPTPDEGVQRKREAAILDW